MGKDVISICSLGGQSGEFCVGLIKLHPQAHCTHTELFKDLPSHRHRAVHSTMPFCCEIC
jgi:hypothetical protein